MIRRPVKVEIFGLGLLIRPTEEGFHARAEYRHNGLTASVHSLVALREGELQDLLEQIERQYNDFAVPVRWRSAGGAVELAWDLDALGHARGRLRLEDGHAWTLDVALVGDQSYLPKMALGLRLLVRG